MKDNRERIVTMDILQESRVYCHFDALSFTYILSEMPISDDGKRLFALIDINKYTEEYPKIDKSAVGYHSNKITDMINNDGVLGTLKNMEGGTHLKSILVELDYGRFMGFITHPNGYKNKKQYHCVEDHFREDDKVWNKHLNRLESI